MKAKLPLAFDYQATTPCDLEVMEAMKPYWEEFYGNPSNRQNRSGLYASAAIELARDQLAELLKVNPERLIFTSGATEANNLALLGYARCKAEEMGSRGHLITLTTEHKSVLEPLRKLQAEGFELTEIKPDQDGLISVDILEQAFKKNTILVSVMLANNEIGVIQPLSQLAELCKQRGVTLHSDAAQGFGNIELDLDATEIDLLTISAHKIYGPKGIGLLVISKDIRIEPLQFGGGQEQGLRPGTIPVPLVIGLAKAAELAVRDLYFNTKKLISLREKLWDGLREELPGIELNGSMEKRLANNLNFTIPDIQVAQFQKALRSFISCSSGSACSNGEPSYVLRELGRSLEEAESSIRLSLGRETTTKDISEAIKVISEIVKSQRSNNL